MRHRSHGNRRHVSPAGTKLIRQPELAPAEQRKLFNQARELGTDESGDAFDKLLKKVASAPPPETIKQRKADIERRKQLVPAEKRKPKRG